MVWNLLQNVWLAAQKTWIFLYKTYCKTFVALSKKGVYLNCTDMQWYKKNLDK